MGALLPQLIPYAMLLPFGYTFLNDKNKNSNSTYKTSVEMVNNPLITQPKNIPHVYGEFKVKGQIIWASDIKKIITSTTTTTETFQAKTIDQTISVDNEYDYTVCLAIGICKGPIQAIKAIYMNGELISNNPKMNSHIDCYYGFENQEPNPLMESYLGIGNVPAYKDLAYIVIHNLSLKSLNSKIPEFSFIVNNDNLNNLEPEGSGSETLTAVHLTIDDNPFIVSPFSTRVVDSTKPNQTPQLINITPIGQSLFDEWLSQIKKIPTLKDIFIHYNAPLVFNPTNNLFAYSSFIDKHYKLSNISCKPFNFSWTTFSTTWDKNNSPVIPEVNGLNQFGSVPCEDSLIAAINKLHGLNYAVHLVPQPIFLNANYEPINDIQDFISQMNNPNILNTYASIYLGYLESISLRIGSECKDLIKGIMIGKDSPPLNFLATNEATTLLKYTLDGFKKRQAIFPDYLNVKLGLYVNWNDYQGSIERPYEFDAIMMGDGFYQIALQYEVAIEEELFNSNPYQEQKTTLLNNIDFTHTYDNPYQRNTKVKWDEITLTDANLTIGMSRFNYQQQQKLKIDSVFGVGIDAKLINKLHDVINSTPTTVTIQNPFGKSFNTSRVKINLPQKQPFSGINRLDLTSWLNKPHYTYDNAVTNFKPKQKPIWITDIQLRIVSYDGKNVTSRYKELTNPWVVALISYVNEQITNQPVKIANSYHNLKDTTTNSTSNQQLTLGRLIKHLTPQDSTTPVRINNLDYPIKGVLIDEDNDIDKLFTKLSVIFPFLIASNNKTVNFHAWNSKVQQKPILHVDESMLISQINDKTINYTINNYDTNSAINYNITYFNSEKDFIQQNLYYNLNTTNTQHIRLPIALNETYAKQLYDQLQQRQQAINNPIYFYLSLDYSYLNIGDLITLYNQPNKRFMIDNIIIHQQQLLFIHCLEIT